MAGATVLAAAAFLLWRLADPLGVRPDSWSEAEVMISGINYAAQGFLTHAALPQHQITPPDDPYFLYANYPVLSNLLYGLLYRLGADAGGLYRLPAIAASLLGLWLWYRLVTRVIDRATGVAATVALGTSFGFLAYADNIHQEAYALAPQFGAFLCFAIGVAPQTVRRRRWLIGCASCLLLLALITIELDLWMLIALCGYAVIFGAAVPRRRLVLLAPLVVALPLCAGLALQWMQARAGSPVPAAERPALFDSLYRRSIGFEEAADTPRDGGGRKLSLASYPAFVATRFGEFYRLPPWLLPLLLVFGFAGAPSTARRPRLRRPSGADGAAPSDAPSAISEPEGSRWPAHMKLLVLLLAAGWAWIDTMMQQTAVHPAAMRQLLPFYALLLGVVWVQALRVGADRRRSVPLRAAVVLAALGTLILHGSDTWGDVRLRLDHTYQHALLQEPGWSESTDLAPLSALPPGSIILTNHNRVPLIRYWSRHPVYLAPNGLVPGRGSRRNWLELTMNHLRGLYGDALPPVLYLYRLVPPGPDTLQTALAADPLLRALSTGTFEALAGPSEQQRAVAAYSGAGPSACPILMRGSDWVVFEMGPVLPDLLRVTSRYPIPTLKDLPPPR